MKRLFAVRGATTVVADTREAIVGATQELLKELFARNDLERDDLVSIIFTATDDLHAEFPAAGARLMGLTGVPLMCARELDVQSELTMDRCIRVLVHCYAEAAPEPVYLGETERLREPPRPT